MTVTKWGYSQQTLQLSPPPCHLELFHAALLSCAVLAAGSKALARMHLGRSKGYNLGVCLGYEELLRTME